MDTSVLFGDTLFVLKGSYFKIPFSSNPKYKMPFCHQSVFVKTELLKKYGFDTSFKICADNDFFTKLYHRGYQFYPLNQIVSIYDIEGISSTSFFRGGFEDLKIGQKYNKFYFIFYTPKFLYAGCKYFIKKIIPTSLLQKIRTKLYERS
ncbi:hypothetical protein [Helicobacter sp. 11S03491-1]|uniref:hypothetical protein n=1 Tax=Helicobacter sp. 11S03491-1 TaxID=1476196 RepID=UPI000BA7D540|nr:hypothetical protein [Helicobacter sp. 11S03491-1]PAF43795.1 hypothetical protein BKH45_00585 [Helicobacter sp. 11S03491-1]